LPSAGSPLFSQTGAPLDGTANTAVQSLRISAYGTGSSADGSKELFFDNLSVTGVGVLGDYNNNGSVDAADYVVWRNTLGATGSGLPADGNGNGAVDPEDYTIWRSLFGSASATASSQELVVPEPAGACFCIYNALVFGLLRIRSLRR